ncbi:hypothetical protein SDC9_83030 [bioreactor metagenome]|uniref:Fibronectin type-III domain-containing protein n=1 Tax=bioreactor metagenome TaxID=1076179 RepID=A0A644ZEY4_9ZZZZ
MTSLKFIYLLCGIIFLFTGPKAMAQVTLYSEDFSNTLLDNKGQNGTTYDMSGVTNWSINVANGGFGSGLGDAFKQLSSAFYVHDADGSSEASACWWYSTVIDISCYTNVTLSADLIRSVNSNSGLYVRMYYSLNGGAWTAVGTAYNGGAAAGSVNKSVAGLSGNSIQIRIGYWGTSSTGSMGHDNVLITGVEGYPTLQASGLTLTNYTGTSIDLSWTNNSGDKVLVIAKPVSASLVDPVKGISYAASNTYGMGNTTGPNNYVVYDGTGNSVTITGLTAGTDYDFAVYAYNSYCPWYNTNELFGSTLCTPPATTCSGVSISGITANSMNISWTNGNGDATLVVARPTSSAGIDPVSGTVYTANPVFGAGSITGTNNYVVYSGTGTGFTLSGLTSSTSYSIAVYTYYSANNCYNTSEAVNSATTLTLSAPYEMDNINGSIIYTCSGSFTDAGGAAGNYGNNENYTATFCSSSGLPLKFDFSTAGSFDIDVPGDTLYFYDGFSASGTPIAILTYLDDNTQTTYSSQLVINTLSPVVTVRWKSNSSGTDAGWSASISCGNPPVCASNPPASDIFGQATPMCNISNYCGTTATYYGEDTPYNLIGGGDCPVPDDGIFGATIENNSWLKFEALSTTATFNFNVFGASCGSSIQAGVLAFNTATSQFSLKSPCSLTDAGQLGTFTLTATGLTIGEVYYLMIDGYAGDLCDYTIGVNTGVAVVNAGPDQVVCTSSATLSATSTLTAGIWEVVSGSGTFADPTSPATTVSGLGSGVNVFSWTSSTSLCGTLTDQVVVTSTICLPVTLTEFSASCLSPEVVEISWTTASETNCNYFVVERSENSFDFVPVRVVPGAGNSNSLQHYSITDTLISSVTEYFRLRQVDYDGTASVS